MEPYQEPTLLEDSIACIIEAFERLAQTFAENAAPVVAAYQSAAQTFMDNIAQQYPEVLDEDDNWRDDWIDVIKRANQL